MWQAELTTPGKINLFLKITGKRPDGYHEIETVFMPLREPADKIIISEAAKGSGIQLSSDNPELPLDSGNLCWKAADSFARRAGLAPDWSIRIEKNIPVAAGLGGGSSDAGAVLRLLNGKYNALSSDELSQTALDIGADVPYFLNPTPAIGKGLGEELEPFDFDAENLPLLIAAPMFPVRAAWAYQNAAIPTLRPESSDKLLLALKKNDWDRCGQRLYNDLAHALLVKFPLLAMLKESLERTGATGAEISGSGPTMFAVYKDKAAAEAAQKMLFDEYRETIKIFLP